MKRTVIIVGILIIVVFVCSIFYGSLSRSFKESNIEITLAAEKARTEKVRKEKARPARKEEARLAAEKARKEKARPARLATEKAREEARLARLATEKARRAQLKSKINIQILADTVDEIVNKFKSANIAYNAPSKMKKMNSEIIHLVISRAKSIESLKVQIKEKGEKTGDKIKLSSNVRASLVGHGFEILPITPEEQLITNHRNTHYKWEVTPIKSGKLLLHLSISAIVKYEGVSTNKYIKSYDKVILVDVDNISKIKGYILKNWQWFLGSFIIPLLGFYLYRKDIVIQVDDDTEINFIKQKIKPVTNIKKDIFSSKLDEELEVIDNNVEELKYMEVTDAQDEIDTGKEIKD